MKAACRIDKISMKAACRFSIAVTIVPPIMLPDIINSKQEEEEEEESK